MGPHPVTVGMRLPQEVLDGGRDLLASAVTRIADVGLDHVVITDHVSFYGGEGADALVHATAITALHPTLSAHVSVYLLPLRHPVTVARQLATIGQLAAGRLVFGVGIGGEDPHEVAVCGVDPHTRGARANESLEILRGLLAGDCVTFTGKHFQVEEARILPPPCPAIPIVVGGRSDAALTRAGRFGDGWLGIWCSAGRFASAIAAVEETAATHGRSPRWQHGLVVWCGVAGTAPAARALLGPRMEALYHMPFEPFERYSPTGPPEQVADFLRPYLEAGATQLDLIPVGESIEATIDHAAAVRELLLD